MSGVAQQRDAADEGRLDACGSIVVGRKAIVNQGEIVRPSQLIASVRHLLARGDTMTAPVRATVGERR